MSDGLRTQRCADGEHERCAGIVGGHSWPCTCTCHGPTPPQASDDAGLDEAMKAALAQSKAAGLTQPPVLFPDEDGYDMLRAAVVAYLMAPLTEDGFGDGWEPDRAAVRLAAAYLAARPEQGEWAWDDHCEGLAGGILHALHRMGYEVRQEAPGD